MFGGFTFQWPLPSPQEDHIAGVITPDIGSRDYMYTTVTPLLLLLVLVVVILLRRYVNAARLSSPKSTAPTPGTSVAGR